MWKILINILLIWIIVFITSGLSYYVLEWMSARTKIINDYKGKIVLKKRTKLIFFLFILVCLGFLCVSTDIRSLALRAACAGIITGAFISLFDLSER